MSMQRYAELNMYRIRGYEHIYSINSSFTWTLEERGSFLKITANGTSALLTFSLALPANPSLPTGQRIWVEFVQGGGGGNYLLWNAPTFKFQTAGDAIPNPTSGKITIWTGIFGVGVTSCYMTKMGEW